MSHQGAAMSVLTIDESASSHLVWRFPADRRHIARLSYDEKMEWYAFQFQRNPGVYPVELTTRDFERFWKWNVAVPLRLKRFIVRVKTGQIFKRYEHITEMKAKVKPHAI